MACVGRLVTHRYIFACSIETAYRTCAAIVLQTQASKVAILHAMGTMTQRLPVLLYTLYLRPNGCDAAGPYACSQRYSISSLGTHLHEACNIVLLFIQANISFAFLVIGWWCHCLWLVHVLEVCHESIQRIILLHHCSTFENGAEVSETAHVALSTFNNVQPGGIPPLQQNQVLASQLLCLSCAHTQQHVEPTNTIMLCQYEAPGCTCLQRA